MGQRKEVVLVWLMSSVTFVIEKCYHTKRLIFHVVHPLQLFRLNSSKVGSYLHISTILHEDAKLLDFVQLQPLSAHKKTAAALEYIMTPRTVHMFVSFEYI